MLISILKAVEDDKLAGDSASVEIRARVVDELTNCMVVDAFVSALKSHQRYKQHLTVCMVSVAQRTIAEYAANVQSTTISVLANTVCYKR